MQSDEINELVAALAKASATIENAKINKYNPHYKNRYAGLESCLDAVRKPLGQNGLIITQMTEIRENGFVLVTMLAHASGQWIKSEYPLPVSGKQQDLGSALTYARRYCLSAIAAIAADEDDDAEDAEEKKQTVSVANGTGKEEYLTAEQQALLRKLITDKGRSVEKFCANIFDVATLANIPASQYSNALAEIANAAPAVSK